MGKFRNHQLLRLRIEGMTCEHCELTVTKALQEAGASDVHVDFRRKEAVFKLAEGINSAAVIEAVKAVGYQPSEIEALSATIKSKNGSRLANNYDLAIVGSGSAAFAAAIRARELGARVVMIERGTLGGTCVNVGCVPSKTLLRAGEIYYRAGHHPFSGIHTETGKVDLESLVAQKDELVRTLRQEKYEALIGEYGWDFISGEAIFSDERHLEVNGKKVGSRYILLATGASPAVPPIPGLDEIDYLTSTAAMQLRSVPKSLLVIGSGYVALELGQLFQHMGSKVTLTQRSLRILKEYDPEISEAVHEALAAQGMNFVTGASFKRVEKGSGGYRLTVEVAGASQVLEAEQILVATGRQPNTSTLHVERAGVALGKDGELVVDEYLRTTNLQVFAAGDVTLAAQFVYVAAYQGALAAENALINAGLKADLQVVPAVIFTTPCVATVGLTEQQAKAAGYSVKTSILQTKYVPRALVNREVHGVFKMVAEADTNRILGVQVVAENAGEVIYAATLAVKFNLSIQDLTSTFDPYLTMAEGLKLVAQTFEQDVAKLSCCA